MNCPTCKEVTLVMADRQGIELDYCPQCRGVWLDRGELDKIIERSAQAGAASESRTPEQHYRGSREEREYRDDDYERGRRRGKRRGGFLGDLFDFD